MRRRELIGLLGGAAVVWPIISLAQQAPHKSSFGLLFSGPKEAAAARAKLILEALKESGFIEGANLEMVSRASDNDPDKASKQAIELANLNVNVILAVGPSAVRAARSATSTIPIVAVDLETDPISTGLIATLSHPGGNLTGLFFDFPEFSAKWIQLLQEAIPGLSRLAALWDPTTGRVQVKATEVAAASRGLHLRIIEVRNLAGLTDAFAIMDRDQSQAVLVLSSPLFSAIFGSQTVADLASEHRIPAISMFPEFAEFGGLMGYGPRITDMYHQAAAMVGKVLHGQKPADLPVERPAHIDFVINLKTAKALGIDLPTTLLALASEVIE